MMRVTKVTRQGSNMCVMATKRPLAAPRLASTKTIGYRCTEDQHRRLRMAAAADGVSYADLVDALLEERAARDARRAKHQASPLHRPPPDNLDPNAVAM